MAFGAASRIVVADRNLRGIRAVTLDAFGSLLDGGPKDVLAFVAREAAASRGSVDDRRLKDEWIRVLERHTRAEPFATYREVHSRAFREMFAQLGIPCDLEVSLEKAHRAFSLAAVYPEVRTVLRELEAEIPVAIISNTDTEPLLQALHRNGLEFTFVITSEEEQCYKPSIALFKRALRYLGLPAEHVLHVGDSYGEDVVGAKAAGMDAAFIERPGAVREPPQDGTPLVRTLAEVCDLVRRSWDSP